MSDITPAPPADPGDVPALDVPALDGPALDGLALDGLALDGTLLERLGITILEASAAGCLARMPVAGNTQPAGVLHGGASAALAETVGSVAAARHAGAGRAAVGLELSITHHRSVRTGWVTARAVAQHLGRTTATYLVEVTDDADRRISSARLTCLLLDSNAGSSPERNPGPDSGSVD